MEIDKIIDQLESLRGYCESHITKYGDIEWSRDVKALDAAIEQLKKERWICVNDRLPSREGLMDDETEYVLVKLKHDCDDGYSESICGYTKDGWSDWDNYGDVRAREITHWKPLDEKWK